MFVAPRGVCAEPQTATVKEGGFVAEAQAQGRYTAASNGSVTVELDGYAGTLEVAEVLVTHGRVSRGQAILRLDAPELDEQLTKAREALAKAELGLAWAKQEQAIGKQEQAIAAERRALAWKDAVSDNKAWEAFGKADQYLSAKLDIQQSEARVADEQEELNQLEKLYKDAKLASRTQDIVLERARRRLAVSKQRLEMARRNSKQMLEVLLPRQERDAANRLRWLEIEHKHAVVRAEIVREKQAQALDTAEQAVEEAREVVKNLESDAKALLVVAPAEGVLTPVGLKAGDVVKNGQTLAFVEDAAKGELVLTVEAQDLRVVGEGDRVEVRWQAFAEVESAGTIKQVAWQGEASGADDAKYRVTIGLDNVDQVIRPGMLADVRFTRPLENSSLSIPANTIIEWDKHEAYCWVKAGDDFERRKIVLGATSDERLQVLRGLKAGDEIRVSAE